MTNSNSDAQMLRELEERLHRTRQLVTLHAARRRNYYLDNLQQEQAAPQRFSPLTTLFEEGIAEMTILMQTDRRVALANRTQH